MLKPSSQHVAQARHPVPLLDWPLWLQYTGAMGLMGVTLLLGWMLPDIGRAPFLPVLAPLLTLVVLVRTGPFLAATIMGLIGSAFLFIPPFGEVAPPEMVDTTLAVLITVALAAATFASFLSTRAQDARKRAAAEVRWRGAQLQTLFDQAPIGVYLVDAGLRIRQVNPVARETFGKIPGGLLDRDLKEVSQMLWPAEFAASVVARFQSVLESGEPHVAREDKAWRKDREITEHYDWRVDRIVLPDGAHGAVCYFREISEQVGARRAVGASEERLQIAKAAAGLGIHDYHVPDNRVEWDERTRELWGVGPDEPITYELWRDSLHPDDRAVAEEAVARALDPEGDGSYLAEYRVRCRQDGQVRWIQTTGKTAFDNGEPVRLIGTVQDITERKEVEEALREADRRKDEFLAILAHELRNPLGPIRTAASLLPSVRDDPGRFEQVSGVIERQTSTIARLIDDLLDVGRITRGTIELREERLDLAPLVREAADLVRPSCDAKGIELAVEVANSPLVLDGDEIRLVQVLNNLLTNACKYTPAGGRIGLEADREGAESVIVVEDTGIGLAPDDLDRIFEMFAQVDGDRGGAGGLGIGLSLARWIVELHGGSIEAESEGPGTGAKFIVRLPLAETERRSSGSGSREGGEAIDKRHSGNGAEGQTGMSVLLVDDQEDALSPMQMLLEFRGFRVYTAGTGQEALDTAEACRPRAIVLDIGLPDLDGYEVARRIRARDWGSDVFLVALTGWGQADDKQRALDAGFDHHLTKPADPNELTRILRDDRD